MKKVLALWALPRVGVPLAAAAWILVPRYPADRLAPGSSELVLDRHGRVIDELAGPDGTRSRWVPLDELPPHVLDAFVAAEDRRFWSHPGVDPRSLLRAVRDNLSGRRTGASTIAMQVIRLLEPRPRTIRSKLAEGALALRLERTIGRRGVLEQYVNRAPFGNRVTGIEAAARLYFGKPARDLSLAEAAYLAALPKAPTRLDPYRSRKAVARQRWILRQMGVDSAEPLRLAPPGRAFLARHVPRRPGRTTIDLELQTRVEGILRTHLRGLADRHVTAAAAVVLDVATGEILAIAAPGDSWVNAAAARRSPGSTVKPFAYALAFDHGRSPEDEILDEPAHFETPTGDYAPRNYDGRYRGPVTLRIALASSLNLPAVRLVHEFGVARLHDLLVAMDWPLDRGPGHYGLGLVLGDGETTLLALAASYAALARGGEWIAPRLRFDEPVRRARVLARTADVLDVLSDDAARQPGFGRGGPLALPAFAKTGTSADFRDNWCVGGTRRHVVAVWCGNLDGSPMRGVSGVAGAAPAWRDILLAVGTGEPRAPRAPSPGRPRDEGFQVLHPNDWDVFLLDPSRPPSLQTLSFEANGPARWFVDGEEIRGRWPLRRGRFDLVAEGPGGERVRRRFRVE